MIKIILTLIMSALIGYATNYIAVKMLFRPYKPILLKGKRLPFTPGVIPKEQKRLAGAIAGAVSDTLLTEEDLTSALVNDEICEKVSGGICAKLYNSSDKSLKDIVSCISERENITKDKIKSIASEKIMAEIKAADIGAIVVEEGTEAIKTKFSGGMMAMFMNDELINSVALPIGEKINAYIDEKCPEKLDEILERELTNIENMTLPQIVSALEIKPESLANAAKSIYMTALTENISSIISAVDIRKIVEEKVAAMDVKELEQLTLSVMKKELDAVINLGALIGLLIGIITVMINL